MLDSTIATVQLTKLIDKLDGAYASNTLRAYRTDMQEFIRFCADKPFEALPAEPDTVAAFFWVRLTKRSSPQQ